MDEPRNGGFGMSVGTALTEGNRLLTSNYGLMLGASIALLLMYGALAVITGIIDEMLVGPNAWVSPVSMASQVFVQAPLGVGVGAIAVLRYRDGAGSFDDILIGFRRYWPVVGVSLLVSMLTWVILIVGGAVVGFGAALFAAVSIPAAIGVGVVLGICLFVLLVYVSIRLWFATLLCVDPRGSHPGPVDAIKLSWYLTSGYVFKLWITSVILGLIAIACVLLLVLPFLFYTMPLFACVFGVMYVLINPLPPEDGESWGEEPEQGPRDPLEPLPV